MLMRKICILLGTALLGMMVLSQGCKHPTGSLDTLRAGFIHPPDSVRPGVYWYFMDGNLSASGIRKDLLSMKKAGIGRAVFLEVNVGVPQGPVDFLSPQWFDIFRYMEHEADSLGIALTLGVGPGWAGSGGPWITPEQSMQALVSSSVKITGPAVREVKLPLPDPKRPYFGEGTLSPQLKEEWESYYQDVAVLAFPTPDSAGHIDDIDEKALYYRAPFSSAPGVKPFLNGYTPDTVTGSPDVIAKAHVLDITAKMDSGGTLHWQVPAGTWTVMRFVARNTGALTRPAPVQGLGFESSKFDTAAVNWQLQAYVGRILDTIGDLHPDHAGGLKMLHLDSWEMGSQNWSNGFRQEFIKRRGYDPRPFYPAYAGNIVGSRAVTERFLWDVRETASELVIAHYAKQLKQYAHAHGLGFSIEPYDMNPSADLDLGSVGDVPMGEFWSRGYGFLTAFSCIEAASIAHVLGRPVVQGESFTSDQNEAWKQYPGSMKDQGDWAFAAGINEFYYHTFAHKPFADSLIPGMTMGPYGVHWDRKQTWWPMAGAYHRYIARCQYLLQQGRTVADILYLTPEGAPQVFMPPTSALQGDSVMPDRKGFNFDGCSPRQLMQATVAGHRIVFPGGASYRLLVLPAMHTMTPDLLKKVDSLVRSGAAVMGVPPVSSPSLSGYPAADQELRQLAGNLWGGTSLPASVTFRKIGEGTIIWGGDIGTQPGKVLYPAYDLTADVLHKLGMTEDFATTLPLRYTHRTSASWDIYFVSNRSDTSIRGDAIFRVTEGTPEIWDPLEGKTRPLPRFTTSDGHTTIPLAFAPHQSFFVVFPKGSPGKPGKGLNFPPSRIIDTLTGPWTVHFDPHMGGPASVTFDSLADWISSATEGIRFYSGIAQYEKSFNKPAMTAGAGNPHIFLELGKVHDMAAVRLNGKDLGVVWTPPYRVEITGLLKDKGNLLEIRVANRWPNRLIGDARFPSDGIVDKQWPEWLLKGEKRPGKRYTFTSFDPYTPDSPLLSSGLLGPVKIVAEDH